MKLLHLAWLSLILVASAILLVGASFLWLILDERTSVDDLLILTTETLSPGSFRSRDQQEVWRGREITNPAWAPANKSIWGYVDRQSIVPGESFDVKLSTSPHLDARQGYLEIFRIGYYGERDRELQQRSDQLTVSHQIVVASAASTGANWDSTLRVTDTHQWRSGYFALDFVETNGKRHKDVAFVVVTNPLKRGDLLVKLSTNTYAAYNRWGGHSLYRGRHGQDPGTIVSFDRPVPADFYRWEYFYTLWIEELAARKGLSVDYATNIDVHRDESFLDNYEIVISVGHDEYWSKREFDQYQRRIFDRGQDVLFLGANIAYWQVRFADVDSLETEPGRQRQMICHKDRVDPIVGSLTSEPSLYLANRFRDNRRRPETMLMGVGFISYFNPDENDAMGYAYNVQDINHPLFDGTGFTDTEVLDRLIGYEWDNRDPEQDGERLWSAENSAIDALPLEDIAVLFSGYGVGTQSERTLAEAVAFRSSAGAQVFSAGTIRWAWGLNKPGFVNEKLQTFNENLITQFLAD